MTRPLEPPPGWIPLEQHPYRVVLRSQRPLRRGWYMLEVKVSTELPRSVLAWRTSDNGAAQHRILRSGQTRLRVVRLGRAGRPSVSFEKFGGRLEIDHFELRRLATRQAVRLIDRKLRRMHPLFREGRPESSFGLSLAQRWRAYNELLAAEKRRRSLIRYAHWMEHVEPSLHVGTCQPTAIHRIATVKWPALTPAPHGAEWVWPHGPGEKLADGAIERLSAVVAQRPDLHLLYGDLDILSGEGARHCPDFRPAWSPELLLHDPRYSRGWLFRADTWEQALRHIAPLPDGWPEAIYALVLAATRECPPRSIGHHPGIIMHIYSADASEPPRASHGTAQVLSEHLGRHLPGAPATIELRKGGRWGHRVSWPLPDPPPLLSIIIATKDRPDLLRNCLNSLRSVPLGLPFELIVIDHGTTSLEAREILDRESARPEVKLFHADGPFNFSALNNLGVRNATGDLICLLNNDTEAKTSFWAQTMARWALRPEIGPVGPMLLYDDGTVQHAGVLLGIGGVAGHAHKYLPAEQSGFQSRLQLGQNFMAVTGACLMVRREIWHQIGGLDEANLAVNYNDVDFCLRASVAGYRTVYLPEVQLIHHESKSRGAPRGAAEQQWLREREIMLERWSTWIEDDPHYHPGLCRVEEQFHLRLERHEVRVRHH